MRGFQLKEYGEEVQAALTKIIELTTATQETDGLLSAQDKAKLDLLGIYYNTTKYWNELVGFIPKKGEIVIYSDYKSYRDDNDNIVYVPGIKIGSGNAYVQDLVFIDESLSRQLAMHINNTEIHVSLEEKLRWDRKLNIDDEIFDETIVFNRH